MNFHDIEPNLSPDSQRLLLHLVRAGSRTSLRWFVRVDAASAASGTQIVAHRNLLIHLWRALPLMDALEHRSR